MGSINNQAPGQQILALAAAAAPTVGDAIYGGQRQRTRIVQRTFASVDYQGSPFAPYSKRYLRQKTARGGSSNVNLFGMDNHPHMLNRMFVVAGGVSSSPDDMTVPASAQPVDLMQIAFYGEEAMRAEVHNEGKTIRKRGGKGSFAMPERRFFAATIADVGELTNDIGSSMAARINRT